MRIFLRTVVGKTLLFFLCLLSIAACICSVIGAMCLVSDWGNAYSLDRQTFCMEAVRGNVVGEGYVYLPSALHGQTHFTGGNLIVSIEEEDGTVIACSDEEELPENWDYERWFMVNPVYFDNGIVEYGLWPADSWETTDETNTRYLFRASLRDPMPEADDLAVCLKLVGFAYDLRYAVYWIGLAALLTAVFSFIGLMSVSGRKPREEEIIPGPLYRVPTDLLFGFGVTICAAMVSFTLDRARFDIGSELITFVLMALVTVSCIAMLLGLCMSAAVRVKLHTFVKNTVIYRLLRLFWHGCKKLYRFNRTIIRGMSLMRRTTWIVLGVTAVEFICLYLFSFDREDCVFLWFLEKLIAVPAILYTAALLNRLKKGGEVLAEGDLNYQISSSGMWGSLRQHAENLNRISEGMTAAVEDRLKSERLKTELITNVSHDLKTPLTSIINYAMLIDAQPCENEKIREYSDVLVRQSERLKRLMEDLIEASKASTGNLDVSLTACDASVFLTQISGEFEEKLQTSDLTLVVKEPEKELRILADSRRMWRIFDNLMNNICKYALGGTRVYLTLEERGRHAVFTFKNTSREPLDLTEEELMERFTRGDSSRSTEGNGLGLAIARSMAELQNGRLNIAIDGDLFKAILAFPLCEQGIHTGLENK